MVTSISQKVDMKLLNQWKVLLIISNLPWLPICSWHQRTIVSCWSWLVYDRECRFHTRRSCLVNHGMDPGTGRQGVSRHHYCGPRPVQLTSRQNSRLVEPRYRWFPRTWSLFYIAWFHRFRQSTRRGFVRHPFVGEPCICRVWFDRVLGSVKLIGVERKDGKVLNKEE